MNIIDLSNLYNFPEDLLLAKIQIEKELIEDNIIEDRMNINDFILWLDFSKNIYMEESKTIPFSIYNGKDISYLFYIDQTIDKQSSKNMLNLLKSINYDLNKLTKVNMNDLYVTGLSVPESEYFIINSQIYKL